MEPKYNLPWSEEALAQINFLKINKSGKELESYLEKISELIDSIMSNPPKGIGKPEPLKHKYTSCWSRRINIRDRLIYKVTPNSIIILSVLGHYK